MDSSRISPTAHYTGYVWTLHGLSYPALRTQQGALYYTCLKPFNAFHELCTGGPSLRQFLIQRHRVLDHLLAEAIERGHIHQVIEVAAGLSPRGLRFCERFAERKITYIEADLPEMAALKAARVKETSVSYEHHHIVPVDALRDDGPESLQHIASTLLDPSKGTAIITEGLLNYFSPAHVEAMWRRFSNVLSTFPKGLYASDLHTWQEVNGSTLAETFRWALSAFARGQVHIHFQDNVEARATLKNAGFAHVNLHAPNSFVDRLDIPAAGGPTRVRVVEAWV